MPLPASSFKLAPFVHNIGELPIRRPNRAPPAAAKDGPRINDDIRNAQIQLIDQTGLNHGTVETVVAIKMAMEAGMDLVEISPNNNPPVCKIMDYGKYKFEEAKAARAARKKQHVIQLKEVKFRPGIDDHDYDFKARHAREFLLEGNKVKATMMYRGRQMAHLEFGKAVLDRLATELADVGKVEMEAKLEGRNMTMVLAPK